MPEPVAGPGADSPNRRGFLTDTLAIGGAVVGLGDPPPAVGAEPVKRGAPVNPRLFTFVGGKKGGWSVLSARAIVGDSLPAVDRVDIVTGAVAALPDGGGWMLRGVTSNARYVTQKEKDSLVEKQAALGHALGNHSDSQEREAVGVDAVIDAGVDGGGDGSRGVRVVARNTHPSELRHRRGGFPPSPETYGSTAGKPAAN